MIRINRAGAGVVCASLILYCCAGMPTVRPADPALPTAWSRWTEVGGVRVHYVDTDPCGPQEALVIVHGYLGSTIPFEAFIRHLGAERRVVMPDLPGFGFSSAPATDVDAEYYLRFLQSFVAQLGLRRVELLGTSAGAQLGTRYALRSRGQVTALVLGCPVGLAEQRDGPLRRFRSEALLRLLAPWVSRARVRRELHEVVGDDGLIDERILDSYWRPLRTREGRGVASQFLSRIAAREQLESYLPLLDLPVLILIGERDSLNEPRYSARYAQLSPEAEIVLLCGLGHLLFLEAPEMATHWVGEFLQQGDP